MTEPNRTAGSARAAALALVFAGLLSARCAQTPPSAPAQPPPGSSTTADAAPAPVPAQPATPNAAPTLPAGLATAPYPHDTAHKGAPPQTLTFDTAAPAHAGEPAHFSALQYSGWELGTNLNVTIVTGDEAAARKTLDEIIAKIREFNQATSSWMPGTDIATINAQAGIAPVKVSALTLEQVQLALQAARETDGAFDPTWAALWGLWDYSAAHPRVPSDAEIAAKLPLINWRDVVVDTAHSTVFLKRAGMKLDLGGITKGSLVGKLGALLKERGFHDFLVQMGGELIAAGHNPRGTLWRIGMQHPRKRDYYVAAPELTDVDISTSGDYERFFFANGKRYHHIIDPKTGRPSRGLIMVTVIGHDGALCDAYATALMVMGQTKAEAFVTQHPGLRVVTIDRDGNIWSNDPELRKQYPAKIEGGE
ncbi:MAG: FAD:protein FMN transferase [Planctomycetota bacterium]